MAEDEKDLETTEAETDATEGEDSPMASVSDEPVQPVEETADEPAPVNAEGPTGEQGDAEPVEDAAPPDEPAAEAEESPAEPAAEEEPPAEEAEVIEEVTPEAPAAEAEPEPAEPPAAAEAEPKRKKKRLPRALRRQRTKRPREKPAQRKAIVRLPKPESEPGRRQERRGVVVSAASDKTIVVKVDTVKAHAKYKKVVRRSTKFHAHDEANAAGVGDVVRIVETRPLSKLKNWRLAEIVEKAR
jgi:small subunit ribosomal protein S17